MLLAGLLPGQEEAAYFHHLTVEEGLAHGTNHFIYKDSTGFVWLSSLNGLNRFDGRRVKVYKPVPEDSTSLYGQNIQSPFFETAQHNLWFSTYEGLNCYVRKFDSFRHYTVNNDAGQQLFGYYVFHKDQHDNLWIIVDGNKLYHFHIPTRKFIYKHPLPQTFLRATVIQGKDGEVEQVIYIGYQLHGILAVNYEKGQVTRERARFASDSSVPLYIKKVIPDRDLLWMSTSKGFALYHLSSDKLTFYNNFKGKKLNASRSVARLNEQELLVSINDKGVYVFNTGTRQFTHGYSASAINPHGISSNNVNQLYTDSDGGVWLSIDNQGVDYFNPQKQKFRQLRPDFTTKNDQSFNVKALVEDAEGNIWCGTETTGLAVYNEASGTFEWKNKSDGPGPARMIKGVIKLIKDQKNRIWILSWEGLFVWLPGEKRIASVPEMNIFLDGCLLQDGRVLLSAFRGNLFEIKEPSENQFQLERIEAINVSEPFTSIWQIRNGQLFGCVSLKELWVFEPANNFKRIQKIPLEGESASFCELPGDPYLWVANSYGLVRLREDAGKYNHTIYTEKDGLPSSMVNSVIAGTDDEIWIGTGNGITYLNPHSGRFFNFGIVDGIPALQFNAFAAIKRSNGEIWMGTVNGITTFYPNQVKLLDVEARPVITDIRINDQEDPELVCDKTGSTNISEIESLKLDYQRNTISFNFAALEYSHPAATQFKYKMVGVDPEWVEAGRENTTRYAKIPPGEYVFRLRAANSDGIWSDSHDIYIFIEPPFWETTIFYILVTIFGITVLAGIYQARQIKKMREIQQEEEKRLALELERQRIARDVHDDLGSGLSALSLLTEIAGYKESKEELKAELVKINYASRELSGKIREVIWTVNASNDTLASLLSYMNHYALELLDSAEIDYYVSLPDPIPEVTISGEYRRTLFLAFKEALNNILKHAGASSVSVNFYVENNQLIISVADNGQGFDPRLLVDPTGNGLINMQSRMRDINGDCTFKTSPAGTEVTFSFNLANQK